MELALLLVLLALNLIFGGFIAGIKFAKLFPQGAQRVEEWFKELTA